MTPLPNDVFFGASTVQPQCRVAFLEILLFALAPGLHPEYSTCRYGAQFDFSLRSAQL